MTERERHRERERESKGEVNVSDFDAVFLSTLVFPLSSPVPLPPSLHSRPKTVTRLSFLVKEDTLGKQELF